MKTATLTVAAVLLAAGTAAAQDRAQLAAGLQGEGVGGAVTLTETASGAILVRIEASGFEPGWHGFHIHENGICTGDFESAGGHVAAGLSHGLAAQDGPHPGDLPNIYVHDDGVVRAEFFTRGVTLSAEGDVRLLDDDGAAVVIHAGPDDYTSQPSGNAGARVACGVLGDPN